MKRIIPFAIMILLLACNIPARVETQDQSQIATKVAQTLTVVVENTTPSLPPTSTMQLSNPASVTPKPTDTIIPPTNTPTITLTATLPPDAPKSWLGDPSWKDTFTNGNAFGLNTPFEDESTSIKVDNGAMTFSSSGAAGYRWRMTSRNPKNLYLEATFRTTACSGDDRFGIVFRAPDYSSGRGYYFGITCSGMYTLVRWDSTDKNILIPLNPNPNIFAGVSQTNRIGALVNGTSIKLFANDKVLQEYFDSGLTEGGFIGGYTYGLSGITVDMEDISLWILP